MRNIISSRKSVPYFAARSTFRQVGPTSGSTTPTQLRETASTVAADARRRVGLNVKSHKPIEH